MQEDTDETKSPKHSRSKKVKKRQKERKEEVLKEIRTFKHALNTKEDLTEGSPSQRTSSPSSSEVRDASKSPRKQGV